TFRSVHASADGRHAWVVGDYRTALETSDAGVSWHPFLTETSRPGRALYGVLAGVALLLVGIVVVRKRRA
ncbi:MAG TPA: hypothetical protein VFX59_02400, partial [Polyangiales bacterium]|nr:hypothetical protein [Polyangiales bacterium]